jgi:hypothetical protein
MSLLAAVLAAGLAAASPETEAIHIALRGSVRVERPGTTAAYAVDADIVEASVAGSHVLLLGRAVGATRVTVVGAGSIATWNVQVESPAGAAPTGRPAARRRAAWGEHYDSETSRVTSTLDVAVATGAGTVQLKVVNMTKARALDDGFARSAFPLASLSVGSDRRRLILGDELVTRSPLTLDGTLLRGVHLRADRLEVHAGFASSLLYGSLFVPAARENTAGVAYGFGSDALRVSPSLYAFPDAARVRPGARTLLPGLMVEKTGKGSLRVSGEVAWSGALGAAGEISYQTPANRLLVRVRHQPYALPALSIGHPQGTFADLAWSARLARPLALTLTGASARYDDPRGPQRTAGATGQLVWSLGRNWSARAGASVGRYDAELTPAVRTLTVPVGLAFDTGRFGLSALYRHQTNSATNRGGPGGRVTVHGGGRLKLRAFADYQRDAPTLALALRNDPEIARALAEQGLVARTPEDLARLLEENALLLAGEPGVARLTLDPTRAQAGFDLTWSGARTQARVHGLFDRIETTSRWQETRLATVSLTHRVGSTELTAAYTRWTSDFSAFGDAGDVFQVGVRRTFSGGEPGGARRARISGQVYRDSGPAGTATAGVPGVTVRLGDGRTTVTDARGDFVFEGVGRRGRRVEALLPSANSFFTTPSPVEVKDSDFVRFGLRFSGGRLDGRVHDDAGRPVGGLALRVAGAAGTSTAVSDSSGAFTFEVAEGGYTLSLDAASLPAGYEAVSPETRDVRVSLAAPAHADVALRVQRSIGGRLAGAGAGVEVRLRTAGRAVRTDEQGRFLFRYVPAGPDTVEAQIAGRPVTRPVLVPEGPAILHGVDLEAARPAPPRSPRRASRS